MERQELSKGALWFEHALFENNLTPVGRHHQRYSSYILKSTKFAEPAFQSHKKCEKMGKSQQQLIAAKVSKIIEVYYRIIFQIQVITEPN